MPEPNNPRDKTYVDTLMNGRLTRRAMLRRSAALGLAVPAVASLLAACGEDDDDVPAAPGTTPAPTDDDDDDDDDTDVETPEPTDDDDDDDDDVATPVDRAPSFFGDQYEEPQNLGGVVIEGSFADAATVNAVLVSDTASGRIVDMISDPVVEIDPLTVEPIPMVAESIDVSDDGLVYTFPLRQDVLWHDGESVTAEDVRFTYDLHMTPETGSPRLTELTERIESIEVVDDYTVEFRLNFPVSAFLAQNMVHNLVPEHVLADVDPAELPAHPFSVGERGTTIGCGSFVFEEWVKDDHVTLVKNPNYYLGEPFIDQYIYRVVPDQTVLVQQLRTGEVDKGGIQEAFVDEIDRAANVNLVTFDTFSFTFYAYQLDEEKSTLFQEAEVRQALAYALDREALIDAIRFGYGEVAVGTMPVRSWAYNPDGIDRHYEYDPDRARQMLDDAGWVPGAGGVREKDGQRLAFEIYTNAGNEIREQYVTVMQEQWREVGAECTPQLEEWNAFLDRITGTKDFDIFLVGFSWGVDPDQSTMWQTDGGFNMNGYVNAEVDSLLEEGLLTTDQDERVEIYTRMQNIILEDLPSVILDFPEGLHGVNVRVHNAFPQAPPSTAVINAHEWWVDA
jgi:peptide/nickel transport system substrate-binding protein